ncbi:MAG: hypothetical protein IH804_02900 [Planctomycetes bacterium]|nr:hypothetical protein [Planctomycetota bacterium]
MHAALGARHHLEVVDAREVLQEIVEPFQPIQAVAAQHLSWIVGGAYRGEQERRGQVGRVEDLERGVVSDSEVGVCVQSDGYDLSRLQMDVQYRDNTTNLDTTALPVPEVPMSIDP